MIDVSDVRKLLRYSTKTGIFTWRVSQGTRKAKSVAGNVDITDGYLRIRIRGRCYKGHILAYVYQIGEWPLFKLDHRNGKRDDNRWKNLRPATLNQNGANQKLHRDNRTGMKGVTRRGKYKKYRARIVVSGREIHLGMFDTPRAAHLAYMKAAKQHFGEFARAS